MKKVIALLGTKRKRNTYELLLQIEKQLAPYDVTLEILELYKYNVQDCIGCEQCVLKGHCVLQDDVDIIMTKLATCDGIILASPVYLQQVSGKLKTFIDRTCSWYHRPVLAAKPVLCVVTTKGSGLKATLSYLENVATQWGAIGGGTIGRSIFNVKKPVSPKEIAPFVTLLNHPQRYTPSFGQLMGFQIQKALSQHHNPLDASYWQQKHWIHQHYFYPCKCNPLKTMVASTIGNIIRNQMTKKIKKSEDLS